MKPNPEAAQAYALHTVHKQGDWRQRAYLGLAESTTEVIALLAIETPAHYCIVASCVDGSPTLRLNYPDKTYRIGLRLLTKAEILCLLNALDERGIQRRDRLNGLNRHTLRERYTNKLLRRMTRYFDTWSAWRYRKQLTKNQQP